MVSLVNTFLDVRLLFTLAVECCTDFMIGCVGLTAILILFMIFVYALALSDKWFELKAGEARRLQGNTHAIPPLL